MKIGEYTDHLGIPRDKTLIINHLGLIAEMPFDDGSDISFDEFEDLSIMDFIREKQFDDLQGCSILFRDKGYETREIVYEMTIKGSNGFSTQKKWTTIVTAKTGTEWSLITPEQEHVAGVDISP